MISVNMFSCFEGFILTSFPLSPPANPIDTSPRFSKRDRSLPLARPFPLLKFAAISCTYRRIQMPCTGQIYFTNAEMSRMSLQSSSAWNYDRERWCQDQREEGGEYECHDESTLTLRASEASMLCTASAKLRVPASGLIRARLISQKR